MAEKRKPTSVEQIVSAALELEIVEAVAKGDPEEDRAALADRLIMESAGADGYDPEWLAELNRRIDEAEAGTSKTVPAEEVFAKMKARRNARPLSR